MTASGPGREGLTVIYEFDVDPKEQQPLREGLEQLLRDVMSRQPGFVSAEVHLSRDGSKALTTVCWESLDAFERFRDDEDQQSNIRLVTTSYAPRARVYDLVFVAAGRTEVPAKSSQACWPRRQTVATQTSTFGKSPTRQQEEHDE